MKAKNILIVAFIFLLMIVNFGNEPIPPPYHQFVISGSVFCDTLVDKSNYTIGVWGKVNLHGEDFLQINNTGLGFEYPIVLSDSLGNYNLLVNNYYFLDSIKLGIIQPQLPTIFSESYSIDQTTGIPDERYYNNDNYNDGSSGCNSCTTEHTATTAQIIKYQYHLDSTRIYFCL
jgi:hypothetical protein